MPTTHSQDWSDEALLEAAARRDMDAFDTLYRRHEARVYAYLLSIVRDRGTAEDLLVETMTAVWDGAARFDLRSRVTTWMIGIARHKALDEVRRQGRRAPQMALDDAPPIEDHAAGPADVAAACQSASAVRAALAALSEEHAEILRLAFLEDMPYADIAELLGIPANTVKSRVYYAKEQLRHFLEFPAAARQRSST